MNTSSIQSLRDSLSDPAAYPHSIDQIEVRQTHASLVFLTESFAYKLKKPVQLGFLDYSTLDKRKYFCEQEVALNRRLAPDVYLGTVPITRTNGRLQIDGAGEIRDWAVKMKRLPDAANLAHRVANDQVRESYLQSVAEKIAQFHASGRSGAEISRYGSFEVVSRNAMENFAQTVEHIGDTVSESVFDRVRTLTRRELVTHHALIDRRAGDDVPRDTHGDLRLEHVYLLPEGPRPDTITIVDCIEFSDRFRYADPVADMAFLVMDLWMSGRRGLASTFSDAYFAKRTDQEGPRLLPLYTSYRSVVRAKVVGINARQPDASGDERKRLRGRAAGHWLVALDALASPEGRPALILMSGLPGTGKSTIAEKVAGSAGFEIIQTDRVRKELQSGPDARLSTQDPYSEQAKQAIYDECLRRAREALFEGKRVILDATFHSSDRRRMFTQLARQMGVRVHLLICRADREVIRRRLAARTNSISDADWEVYLKLAEKWDPPTPRERRFTRFIPTDVELSESVDRALEYLREVGLV